MDPLGCLRGSGCLGGTGVDQSPFYTVECPNDTPTLLLCPCLVRGPGTTTVDHCRPYTTRGRTRSRHRLDSGGRSVAWSHRPRKLTGQKVYSFSFRSLQ